MAEEELKLASLLKRLDLEPKTKTQSIPIFPPPGASCIGADLDPRVHLSTAKGKCRYLKIVDFLPNTFSQVQEEEVVLGQGDARLVLMSPRRQPELNKVTPTQWATANSRIMAALLDAGELGPDTLSFYLAYSAIIGEYAQVYTWASVLDYDNQYRALQAQYGFQWGSNAPILRDSLLKLRSPSVPQGSGKQASLHPQPPPPPRQKPLRSGPNRRPKFVEGKEACGLFNSSGSCKYGESCKFAHLCDVPACGARHPRITHYASDCPPASGAGN